MGKGQKWVVGSPFHGSLEESNFHLEEFDLPELQDGGKHYT